MNLAPLIQALSDPQAYPTPVDAVQVHQTHISVVFLAATYAYKIKKPVNFGFVQLQHAGKAAALVRRGSPAQSPAGAEVYLGVVPIAQDGPYVRVEGAGSVIEWAVKMQRLPEAATLGSAVEGDRVDRATIEELARRIADFHRRADRDGQIAEYGRFEVVARNSRENFEQSASHIGTTVSASVFERLRSLTEEALCRLRPTIDERAARHVTCDTHGDLRLDHVYLFPGREPPGDMVIIDCIEFNPRFRAADPVADMAFLTMDLVRRGRRDLGARFRDAYFEASGDDQGRILVPFYVSYRATVRGKVDGMKVREPEVGEVERSVAQAAAAAHWLVALGSLEKPRNRPCLVLLGGLPGIGKSTLAQALAIHAGFTVIRSDLVRKELAGASGHEPADAQYGAAIYSAEWTERTYRECVRRAAAGLFEGKRALIDATFRDEAERTRALDAAHRGGVPGLLLICQADPAVVKERLDRRRNDASDADWAIYLETARRWEPSAPRTERLAHVINSGQDSPTPLDQALEVLQCLELWS